MNPQSPNFTVRIANLNICFGTQVLPEAAADVERSQSKLHITPLFASSIPGIGNPTLVRPATGTALGTICARVVYSAAVHAVKALVYPSLLYPPPAVIATSAWNTPPSSAVPGVGSANSLTWTWNTTNSNDVPGADQSMAGAGNKLAVWFQQTASGSFRFDSSVTFLGTPGTSGPCGSGGSFLSLSGGKIYPALWVVHAREFPDRLRVFNADWALRLAENADRPTWENGGEVVLIRLVLDEKHGWELTLAVEDLRIDYHLPFQGTTFGPLHFPTGVPKGDWQKGLFPPVTVVAV